LSELTLTNLEIDGAVLIISPIRCDDRGWLWKSYNGLDLRSNKVEFLCNESFITFSTAGVLRGMHYQGGDQPSSKIVTCIKGAVTDVLLDTRKNSRTYKKFIELNLDGESGHSIYIPEGVAHGFYAKKDSLMQYMMSAFFSPENDLGVHWNSFGYEWRVDKNLIISTRDSNLPNFKN